MADNSATTEDQRETYSVEEAARILGIGRNRVYEAVKRGDIRVVGLTGCRWRVPRREIDRLLNGVAAGKA
jgi:excisionase family DNA binding protein